MLSSNSGVNTYTGNKMEADTPKGEPPRSRKKTSRSRGATPYKRDSAPYRKKKEKGGEEKKNKPFPQDQIDEKIKQINCRFCNRIGHMALHCPHYLKHIETVKQQQTLHHMLGNHMGKPQPIV